MIEQLESENKKQQTVFTKALAERDRMNKDAIASLGDKVTLLMLEIEKLKKEKEKKSN
jgi:hypothetical protein